MSLDALKRSLKRFGMVQDIVWNERTGYVVGGHQRLRILDAENKGTDYDIEVKVVDLSDRDERALNVALNNQNLTGRYDADGLLAILQEQGDGIKDFVADSGFTPITLANEFEMLGRRTEILDELFTGNARRQHDHDVAAIGDILSSTSPPPRPHKDTPEGIAERKAEVEQRDASTTEHDYYFTIVFRHDSQKRKFLAAVGERDTTVATVDGHRMAANLGIDVGE